MEQIEQNDQSFLVTEKIGKLMGKYAVPCIISLLVGALYNIVDQIFIANAAYLASYGNAANTVVFPLTVIALGIAVMIVTYYRYIEKVFSNSNADFDMIASEIKIGSMKLEQAGLSQTDVISQLSEWMRNKAGLGTDSRLACNIVVSFFIQNCEVFHKRKCRIK